MATSSRRLPIVGWREWTTLPALSGTPMKAKIDTGARTSALHAFALELTTDAAGITTAAFEIHPLQRSSARSSSVQLPVIDFRTVRSSNGTSETRPVVQTTARIGDHEWTIDLTLTSRDEMGFRMLLGRAAVRRRFLVDPSRSYQQGKTP